MSRPYKVRNQVFSLKNAVVMGGKPLPGHQFVWLDTEKPGFFESVRWLVCTTSGDVTRCGRLSPLHLIHTWHPVLDIAFSPDGRTLALGTVGGNLHLWHIVGSDDSGRGDTNSDTNTQTP
jgi:hypothetical protein